MYKRQEFEAKEQFYRFEDAFNSSRTAIHTGILPGGGIAYWQAAQALTELPTTSLEEQWGVDIIQQALKQPLLQLAQNAGEDGEKILTELKNYPKNYGYDVISSSYQDMLKAGILDAAGISISALTNAFSIVSLILDTGGLITYDI